MRWLTLFSCLLTAGCLRMGWPPYTTPAGVLFERGTEELATGQEPESFASLIRLHPDSSWAERALALQEIVEERNRLLEATRSFEKELGRCRREGRQKEEELSRLRHDLERLKQLVIEMERRAK